MVLMAKEYCISLKILILIKSIPLLLIFMRYSRMACTAIKRQRRLLHVCIFPFSSAMDIWFFVLISAMKLVIQADLRRSMSIRECGFLHRMIRETVRKWLFKDKVGVDIK